MHYTTVVLYMVLFFLIINFKELDSNFYSIVLNQMNVNPGAHYFNKYYKIWPFSNY
jgi:hypothetical protein